MKDEWEFAEWTWGWRTFKKTQEDKRVCLGNNEESVGVRTQDTWRRIKHEAGEMDGEELGSLVRWEPVEILSEGMTLVKDVFHL